MNGELYLPPTGSGAPVSIELLNSKFLRNFPDNPLLAKLLGVKSMTKAEFYRTEVIPLLHRMSRPLRDKSMLTILSSLEILSMQDKGELK